MMINLYASMVGAGMAELITLPIAIVKTNYHCKSQSSLTSVIKDIYSINGFRGFYVASGATLMAQTVSTSLKYYFYNLFKTFSDNTVLNGICSGVCASIFSHPLDVFKIYKQRSQDFNSDIKSIGTKLLFRGYSKTLIRNVLVSSMLFPLYDLFSTLLPDSVVLASLFTATAVTVILHPIDVMRTRHISLNRNFSYYSVPLFRGLHLNLLKMCPSFVITMVITEFIKKKY